jgi:hypothetical protein
MAHHTAYLKKPFYAQGHAACTRRNSEWLNFADQREFQPQTMAGTWSLSGRPHKRNPFAPVIGPATIAGSA